MLARRRPGERLDAAHASRNRAVAERGNHADVAGASDVRAAAQLHRPAHRVTATLAHGHDPHLFAILLAEQRAGA